MIDPAALRLEVRAVLLASEPATRQQLDAIAGRFGCPVSVCYGLTERTSLAFASHRDGVTGPYRFEPLYALHENRLAGGRSEIVGTSLWNDLMPLIRYCSDDFGTIGADGVCPLIEGRRQELLVARDGTRIPGLSIVIDEATWDFVRLYQVRQRVTGAITLCVVARHWRLSEQQKRFVLDAQVRRWGGWFDIALEEVDDIPLAPNGKRQLVISEVCNA
jgi:phenylacetate-CoA ligase